MPDLFGKKQLGRATTGGRFYATPTERVEAGAVYFPDESSLLFGVAEYTVEAGNLGAFATEGTFFFERPNDWLDSLGRKVFYRPSTGEIVNQDKKGDVLIGFQVLANVPDDKLGVVLTSGENSVVIIVTSTADSGAGSLRQAIADASDGDVILFDSDVFPVGETTSILLSSYITINKSISIFGGFNDGAGGYTSGAEKRFYVYRDVEGVITKTYIDDDNPAQEGETVLFENICRVALDGQGTTRGFAISSSSVYNPTVGVAGIEFTDGLSPYYGGALQIAYSSVVSLTDCNFISCSANYGGAIGVQGTSVNSINNCCFVSCQSTTDGGGISASSTSQVIFNDCIFDACHGKDGGCVRTTDSATININRCVVTGCSASVNGGGVYSTNTSQNTLNDCTITDCSATNGGGVYSTNASQNTLNDCTITDCSATNGGGVYSTNASQNTLNDCTITDCSATNGGGVYSIVSSQNTLNGCTIYGCSASNRGSAIYAVSSSQNTLNSCTISDCSATNGGIFTLDTSQNILNDCIFNNCSASGNGGGCFLSSTGLNELNACTFDAESRVYTSSTVALTITSGITTIAAANLGTATITIADGAALTLTGTATIGAATFTSDGRGYLAVGAGIDTSAATLTNVVLCAYGAGLESFTIDADGASWTAQDLTTPILLEQKGDGDVWATLSNDATGGSYSDTFEIGTTLRAFDGVRFFVASLDAYWQVEPFVVASNGGGGAGDDSPSWTISDATITPNAEEV